MSVNLNPNGGLPQGYAAAPPQTIPYNSAPAIRFGADAGSDTPKETASPKKVAEPGLFDRMEAAANRIKEFIDLFSETLHMAKRGLQDAFSVVKNLPKWDQLLKDADAGNNNSAVDRLKSVLDVTMAEFRAGYAQTDNGDDLANFALYSGVLKRFPGLAAMPDNELAKTVLDGALASNPFKPADEARTAFEDLVTRPDSDNGSSDKATLSTEQVEDALGIPGDIKNTDVTNPSADVDSER